MIDLRDILASLRRTAIRAGLEAASLIPPALERGPWSGSGLIFTLHHVRPGSSHPFQPNAPLSVTPQFLDAALRVALECGLAPVRLEDIPHLQAGAETGRFFAVTLDDGYRDNAEFAAPVFRRHGVPYTIFVTSGFVQRSCAPWWETAERLLQSADKVRIDLGAGAETFAVPTLREKSILFNRIAAFVNTYDEDIAVGRIEAAAKSAGIDPYSLVRDLVMDEAELRELAARDPLVSFGAHTVTHCNLKRLGTKRLSEEIIDSSRAVESYVGRRPSTFAYPYGWPSAAGEREARAVAEAGLAVGVTTRPGVLRSGARHGNQLLPRVSLNGLYQEPKFVRALVSGLPFLFR